MIRRDDISVVAIHRFAQIIFCEFSGRFVWILIYDLLQKICPPAAITKRVVNLTQGISRIRALAMFREIADDLRSCLPCLFIVRVNFRSLHLP